MRIGDRPESENMRTMLTVEGKWFDMLEPDPLIENVSLHATAWGLAGEYRYGNQSPVRYSVCEHAVRIVWALRQAGATPDEQLCGLHHDDPEGLGFKDLPLPLKRSAPETYRPYSARESVMLAAIYRRYGLPTEWTTKPPAIVADFDRNICKEERIRIWRGATWSEQSYPGERRIAGAFPRFVPVGWPAWLAMALFKREHKRIQALRRKDPASTATPAQLAC